MDLSGSQFDVTDWSKDSIDLAKDILGISNKIGEDVDTHCFNVAVHPTPYGVTTQKVAEKLWADISNPCRIWSGASKDEGASHFDPDLVSSTFGNILQAVDHSLDRARIFGEHRAHLAAPNMAALPMVHKNVKRTVRDHARLCRNFPFIPDLGEDQPFKINSYTTLSNAQIQATPGFPFLTIHPYREEINTLVQLVQGVPAPWGDGRATHTHVAAWTNGMRLPSNTPHPKPSPMGPNSADTDLGIFHYVTTPDALRDAVDQLNSPAVDVLAVDVEHTTDHCFSGAVCVVQLSAYIDGVLHDYVIDALELQADMALLRHVFADPGTLKILHGATNDVKWLQRDFGIYIVNMLDTYEMLLVLDGAAAAPTFKGRRSLAAQLQVWGTGYAADKANQTADWATRPMSDRKVTYARGDTHYLMFIASGIWGMLVDADPAGGLARRALLASCMKALEVHENPLLTTQSATYLWGAGAGAGLTHVQQTVGTAIYEWRDEKAREADEPPTAILPDHTLVALAQACPTSVFAVSQILGAGASPIASNGAATIQFLVGTAVRGRWVSAAFPTMAPTAPAMQAARFVHADPAPPPRPALGSGSFFESIGWADGSVTASVSAGSTVLGPASPDPASPTDGPAVDVSRRAISALAPATVRGTRIRSSATKSPGTQATVDIAHGLIGAGWIGAGDAGRVADRLFKR